MKKALFLATALALLAPAFASAQSVDLLWQGETYAPPFYEGRTLWSKESRITFFAAAQGLGDPAKLNYRWSRNGTVLGSLSGAGRRSLQLSDTVLSKPIAVKVEIVDADNAVLASSAATLAPIAPQAIVYEKHPLYGYLFNLATYAGYPMGSEATFSAFPLFFDVAGRQDANLSFAWKTNGQGASSEPSVTFRAPDDQAGIATVSVSLKHAKNVFSAAEKGFSVTFDNDASF